MIVWISEWVIEWMDKWVNVALSEWKLSIKYVIERQSRRVIKQMNEQVRQCRSDWGNERVICLNDCVVKWVSKLSMIEWQNLWMSEWVTSEAAIWTSKQVNRWTSDLNDWVIKWTVIEWMGEGLSKLKTEWISRN